MNFAVDSNMIFNIASICESQSQVSSSV